MRKTAQILSLERRYAVPIEQIIAENLNTHGSISGAARELGVKRSTLYYWMIRLGIRTKKIAVMDREHD